MNTVLSSKTSERRRQLIKHLRRMGITGPDGIQLGSPAYFTHVQCFMPIEIDLGYDKRTGSRVSWLPGSESNGFLMVLGSSGSGKTETLKKIGAQLVEHAIPVLVLDFHADVIIPGVESILLSSGSASTVGLNPLELDFDQGEVVGLYDQRAALVDLLYQAIPRLTPRQRQLLHDALFEAYRQAGFDDNDSATWVNPPPQPSDVIGVLHDWLADPEMENFYGSIPGCLVAVRELFDHPVFARDYVLSIEGILSSNVRLDLSKVSDGVRFIIADTLLRKIFRVLRLKGPLPVNPVDDSERFRIFIIIDETKLLSMGKGDPGDNRQILNILISESRKFGVGLVLASQMAAHFSDEVQSNIGAILAMRTMSTAEAKRNAATIGIAPADLLALRGRGDGYIRCGSHPDTRLIQITCLPHPSEPWQEPADDQFGEEPAQPDVRTGEVVLSPVLDIDNFPFVGTDAVPREDDE